MAYYNENWAAVLNLTAEKQFLAGAATLCGFYKEGRAVVPNLAAIRLEYRLKPATFVESGFWPLFLSSYRQVLHMLVSVCYEMWSAPL